VDKLRVNPDKYFVFRKLGMKTLSTMYWDKLCGIKDTDVKIGSLVVWCKDEHDFYKGKVTERWNDNGRLMYRVKYTDGDVEDLSLEHLRRKLHIEFGSEDIPHSEASA
jgi:hypothetical protein